MRKQKSKIADQVIARLRELQRKLQNHEDVDVTVVRREETPDGPLHTHTKKKIKFPEAEHPYE